MIKIKVLYHGSSKKLIGDKLFPKQSIDLEKNLENLIKGVYATDIKDLAIAMAIICSKGTYSSSLDFEEYKKGESKGIIYKGWPKQKHIYLYTLPIQSFKKSQGINHQFVSKKPVKPLKIEKLLIKNNLHLVRKATKKEKNIWTKKYIK
ncbi:hypothetical protein KAT80_03750 [Candidatus Pacearchaeota archaeon]|nr:hypothetical protein [Candidatus Pacearchaeota archaeon]